MIALGYDTAMELRHLKSFVAVAEELHFAKTANRLRLAQSSLSKQIRLLEEELGFPLFYRTKQKVELLDAGHVLLDEARRMGSALHLCPLLSPIYVFRDRSIDRLKGISNNCLVHCMKRSSRASTVRAFLDVVRAEYPNR